MSWQEEWYDKVLDGLPALHRAAALGDHDGIEAQLAAGVPIDSLHRIACTPGGAQPPQMTPLAVAAGSKFGATAETVRLLIEAGADPTNETGWGLSTIAAVRGWHGAHECGGFGDRLEVLLSANAPLPPEPSLRTRLLADAARYGDAACLRGLLVAGISPDPYIHPPKTGMTTAVKSRGDVQFERDQWERAWGETPFEPGAFYFESPIHSAALGGSGDRIKILFEYGAASRVVDSWGYRPIEVARSVEAIEALHAADPEFGPRIADELLDALEHHDTRELRDAVPRLLELGAVVRGPTFCTWDDPLCGYAWTGNLPATRHLIDLGFTVRTEGHTALHSVSFYPTPEEFGARAQIARLLLDLGVPASVRDENGQTPLHEAIAGDGASLSVMRVLIDAGADVNARGHEGRTPLIFLYDTMFSYDDPTVIRTMLDAGANPNLRDDHGRSALDVAEAMAQGEEPLWRAKRFEGKEMRAGWKSPAEPGSGELESLALLREAAARYPRES